MTERILERVRKLLAIANDDAATEGERDNALRMAHNTLAKHQLDMIDVDKHVRDKDDPRGLFEMDGWNIPWCRVVRAAVAHLFSVKYFHCKINATKGRHSFVGRESQATTAMLMGDWIVKALLREADQRYGHRLTRGGRSFGEGAGAKLWQRVNAMVQTKEQEYGGGFALALVSEDKLNAEFALELCGELGKAKARKFDVDSSAYVSGKAHAETINLNKQLEQEEEKRAIEQAACYTDASQQGVDMETKQYRITKRASNERGSNQYTATVTWGLMDVRPVSHAGHSVWRTQKECRDACKAHAAKNNVTPIVLT